MNALIYVRFSTPKQEEGSSEARQLDACRRFIGERGWTEITGPNGVPYCADLGRSAWKGNHLTKGNLGKLSESIFNREVPPNSVIVCENLDRLSRQKARVTQRWIENVCDAGVKIATVAGGKVYDAENLDQNLLSILEVLFLAEGANRYVETLSTRVKASYSERLKRARIDNTPITTRGPAWLRCVNGKWEPIPERATIVREIYDLTIQGKGAWAIAREFNTRPDCRSFTGKAWERTAIVKILRNPAVEGDKAVGEGKASAPTGEVLAGYYADPVVPLNIVAEARAMMERRRNGKGRNSGAVNNLFGKLLRCGDCKGRMMLAGYKSSYLTCYEANRGNGCAHTQTYHYRPFERSALDVVLHYTLDERFFRQAEKSNHMAKEIAEAERALRNMTADVDYAYELAKRTKSPTAERKYLEAEAELEPLKAALDTLHQRMAAAQGAADAEAHLRRVHGVREALEHPDDEVRLPARLRVSEALQAVVNNVVCENGTMTLSLIAGAYGVRFDRKGVRTGEVFGHLPTVKAEGGAGVADVLRRMAGHHRGATGAHL